ncbi:MAG: Elongation factor P [Candidatus Anoxychlamydiales bacterium]|nr:Elongation factor P [Candidatus Anoxychlamydiales bacterium]NGX51779.1 Elongation factor P [Candidatus Anoxychlamydiales bacterium]
MPTSNQLSPGMTINIDKKIFRVESCVKVSTAKGTPFIKTKLRDLLTEELIEKNFKLSQKLLEVSLVIHDLEYLYIEGKNFLFLDIGELENALVPPNILGDKINFLKEGIRVKAFFYGNSIFSIELPQFLELMVTKTTSKEDKLTVANPTKIAVLETGAKIDVPLFVEVGDIVKVDTNLNEFIQRL